MVLGEQDTEPTWEGEGLPSAANMYVSALSNEFLKETDSCLPTSTWLQKVCRCSPSCGLGEQEFSLWRSLGSSISHRWGRRVSIAVFLEMILSGKGGF